MKYGSAATFRQALEDRLKERAGRDGARIARLRKQVAFDRLLARLASVAPGLWALKGGFALELRLADRARTTIDVDIAWSGHENELLDTLIDAATEDLGDFFSLSIERTADPAARFGGAHRFRVATSLAGRLFETFLLDIGEGEADSGDLELLATSDLLGFAGIDQVLVPAIPITRQVAEKLHAYTRRYEGGRPSSRTKDLVDLALIAHLFTFDAVALALALQRVFEVRGTHDLPSELPPPPADWRTPYRQLAAEVGIETDLAAGHAAVAAMLDPILQNRVDSGTWDPESGQWKSQLLDAPDALGRQST
ncbi:MAG TPA: nucleotidyl transferase AbiEii/AbiGii toxin family protein [Tepidiformaceae bacterium]